MEMYVGTSGWRYPWNKGNSLEWYISNSGLNAIELNSSFYRFPYKNQISAWASKGNGLAWVVKVNRIITHVHMLNEKSYSYYESFTESFKPFGNALKLFLIQMPPRFSTSMEKRLVDFTKSFDEKKMAIEFRHKSWYGYDFSKMDFKGVIVSPDSPEYSRSVTCKNGSVYMRFHGRKEWYNYNYSKKELIEMISKIKETKSHKLFAFFNNDAYMMKNATEFSKMLE